MGHAPMPARLTEHNDFQGTATGCWFVLLIDPPAHPLRVFSEDVRVYDALKDIGVASNVTFKFRVQFVVGDTLLGVYE